MENEMNDGSQNLGYSTSPDGTRINISRPTFPEQDDVTGRLLQIKGTPSTILLVLLLTNRPFSKQQLHMLTGISHKPIRRALNQLQALAAVCEDEYHHWRISDEWRCQIIALIVANNTGVPLEHFSTSYGSMSSSRSTISPANGSLSLANGTISAASDTLSPANGRMTQSSGILSPSAGTVVVDYMSEEMEIDLQQQQSFNSVGQPISDVGTISPAGSPMSPAGDTISPTNSPISPDSGTSSPPVGAMPAANGSNAETAAVSKGELAAILRRMGVVGRAKENLLARQDLKLDPTPVLAWWWNLLAQEGVYRPVALTIRYLLSGEPPPTGYLALVRLWPKVDREHRRAIEETVQRNWSAEELSHYWSNSYPEWTAEAFIALKELYLSNPDVLEL